MKHNRIAGIFTAFVLAAWLAGCAMQPEEPATPAEAPHAMDEDEILVLDPPADYLRHLPDLGLEIVDVTHLPGIESKLYHLRIKDGAHPHHARDKHQRRFPDVVVDAHHHYEHHAARVDKSYTARNAAHWKAATAACGKGLRIGVIDSALDVKHPAFKGTKITYRSFHLKGQKAAKDRHGNAVTAVIAGRGAWAVCCRGSRSLPPMSFIAAGKGNPRAAPRASFAPLTG